MAEQQNLVDFTPTAAELTAYDAALGVLETFHKKYGAALSEGQRRTIPRLAAENVAEADAALSVAQADDGFLPRNFAVDDFAQDATLHQTLVPRYVRLTRVFEMADDTMVALRSDLYTAMLTVYSYAKGKVSGPGMDRLTAAMGKRFRRPGRSGTPQLPTAP